MESFERNITYKIQLSEKGLLALSAQLTDRFHDIYIEVFVDPKTLIVQSVNANFGKYPSADCPTALKALEKLPGLQIGKGLNKKLSEILGGVEGCGNLRTLLTGLLPLALNARAAAECQDDDEILTVIHQQLLGTCAGYAHPPKAG